jgi:hypothetical protein
MYIAFEVMPLSPDANWARVSLMMYYESRFSNLEAVNGLGHPAVVCH